MTWKKGQSGNPKGRPAKTHYFSEQAQEMLLADRAEITYWLNDKPTHISIHSSDTIGRTIVLATIAESLKGCVNATKLLVERVEGLPPQTLDINNDKLIDKLKTMSEKQMLDYIKGLCA